MGRAREIQIETRTFKKAGDGTAFFREMLNRYSPGDRVDASDSVDLAALLKRHDEYADKVGEGVDHYKVDNAPDHNTKCFWIVRADGSEVDFSYGHCLEKKDGD